MPDEKPKRAPDLLFEPDTPAEEIAAAALELITRNEAKAAEKPKRTRKPPRGPARHRAGK